MDSTNAELDLLIARFESLADNAVDAGQKENFVTFLRYYFETTALQELLRRDADELFEVILAHWQLAQKRSEDQTLVRVSSREEVAAASPWTLDVVAGDMPFLVDTVSMAVRRQGGVIESLVHPVLAVGRDSDGKMRNIAPLRAGTDDPPESFIHIEFSHLAEGRDKELADEIEEVLLELRHVVQDWQAMMSKVDEIIDVLEEVPSGCSEEEYREVQAFMGWLKEHHFTFLGYRESLVEAGKDGNDRIVVQQESNLGLLREELPGCDAEGFVAPAAELDKYAQSARLLVVTKGNRRSRIHHPEYIDVVTIKRMGVGRKVLSTHRFIGLFSAEAYLTSPRLIPVLREKYEHVIKRSRLRANSHASKNLREVLESYPRDELVQSSEDELFETAMGILSLRENIKLRMFLRRDRYGRFYSCLVFMPRDRFSRDNRERIANTLKEQLQGNEVESNVSFWRVGAELVRIQYTIHTTAGTQVNLDADTLETRLIEVTRTWKDRLSEHLCKRDSGADALLAEFQDGFPVAYRSRVDALEAAADLEYLRRLGENEPLLLRLIPADGTQLRLKLYVWQEAVPLSAVLPVLEHYGMRVITQHPYKITSRSAECWVQEFELEHDAAADLAPDVLRKLFEDAFPRTWDGRVESDGLNRLVLGAQLDWRQVVLLRLICKYLLQMRIPFSQTYMEEILASHAEITRDLIRLFGARFDPQLDEAKREERQQELNKALEQALDEVASLDADRVLRGFHAVILAGLRTNFYQPDDKGEPKPYISLKVNPEKIPEMPRPRPMFETFVYAPWVEGVHLRGGKVARGGLRWSDRREDFRTEVLGLVKAQMVKNAVIVPVGAKGGFVVKKGPDPSDRKAWLDNGIECYKTFIRGLLDITDNLTAKGVDAPQSVVRHDEDDPYLVVAADKGTATFSDIANGLSGDYGFWLGDAFASGGSAGYDHKKMGITARGAWESVKRHFREIGVNCQEEEFTVVGVGDMGGDVFGNGMLLSEHIRLVAAFNHLHIFIDPDPDAASSFKERKRLFEEVAGWDKYNTKKISKGGGIYSRKDKSIELSKEARKALGIEEEALSPTELINRILKAPVDLFWNGGIGTYVKGASESHMDVGDRANDGLRVNGKDLRCKIIGEGGNLGLTQLGRIEFALNGGRANTDAIDNSGGVDSSDREVNIKIPLNELLRDKSLKQDKRDKLLVAMTEEVADKVLEDNYAQSQAISLLERASANRLDEHANLMRMLERDGLLDRAIEFLPDEDALNDRRNSGLGLTRPEIAVLLSYSKISLFEALQESGLPDDELLTDTLLEYFPRQIVKQHRDELLGHRLRRDIIATVLTNNAINRMGMAFIHRAAGEVGTPRAVVAKAYLIASRVFTAEEKWASIEELDNQVTADAQYSLLGRVKQLIKHTVGWLLAHGELQQDLGSCISRYAESVRQLEDALPDLLCGPYAEEWKKLNKNMAKLGAPDELASRLANTLFLTSAFDIVELSEGADVPLEEAARCYFLVGERLRVPWMLDSIIDLAVDGRWQALARGNLRDDTYWLHRRVTEQVLACEAKDIEGRFDAWREAHAEAVEFGMQRIKELQTTGVTDFLSLAVGVRELRKLMRLRVSV